MVVRKQFKPAVRRFNKRAQVAFPSRLPERGRMMRLSAAERRLIQRRRSQTTGIRRITTRGIRRIG